MKLERKRAMQFFAKVHYTDTCWLWTASYNTGGYGSFSALGKSAAHLVSYIHHKGPMPAGYQADHLCSTPACVNPDHLEAVTFAENMARKKIRNRWRGWPTHCREGHLMDDHTTFWRSNGKGRQCRVCLRARQSEHAVRNGENPFKLGDRPNKTLQHKHLYLLTAEDYEAANLSEAFLEIFWACDNLLPFGSRETTAKVAA